MDPSISPLRSRSAARDLHLRRHPSGSIRIAAITLAAMVTIATGCATMNVPLPDPAEIPFLEQELASSPDGVPILVRLGVAYRQAGRLDDARTTLERAVAIQPNEPAGVFYLGLTYEELDRPTEARELYERYLAIGTNDNVKRLITRRLPSVERQQLVQEVRAAVTQEAQLANVTPQPRTVAVFPFAYRGADPQYAPLGRALAEMLVTDLSQTERLTLLERSRIQLLLDELDLGASGAVEAATAARTGRLLGAERIVQGQMDVDAERLRLQTAIVGTTTGTIAGAPLTEEDALPQLFAMQKRLVLALYSSLGVELTPAERERVTRIPTENLQALLAYGRCLEAEDAGDYAAASAACSQAAQLDRGFAEAVQKAQLLGETASVASMTFEQVALAASPEIGGASLQAASSPLPGLEAVQAIIPQELPRPAVPEALGTDDLGRSTTIDIIIRRP